MGYNNWAQNKFNIKCKDKRNDWKNSDETIPDELHVILMKNVLLEKVKSENIDKITTATNS